jgi:putative copper resistance protein D
MRRLARFVAGEAAVALAIVAVSSALTLTPPARHDTPTWPFAHRLAYEAVADVQGVNARLLIGSQLATAGILGAILGALVRQRRALLFGVAAVGLVAGFWVAIPPLAVDAYPTTYRRPTVPYHAASIASGLSVYRTHCAVCHGVSGHGDGPGGAGLRRAPADLTAPHTGQHTAGDLFWWVTRGIPASGMPPFGDVLAEEERWDVINFVRALAAGERARPLGPVLDAPRPWLAAPDFGYAVGPAPAHTLKELRGRTAALVVLFSLESSRPRLAQLAALYPELQLLGAEVIAAPVDADPRVLRRLGAAPPILYPVVTDGAAEIVATYGVFARTLVTAPPSAAAAAAAPAHVEFLIDRQGYIRGRWIPGVDGPGWSDAAALRGHLARLQAEAPAAPAPDEHVH